MQTQPPSFILSTTKSRCVSLSDQKYGLWFWAFMSKECAISYYLSVKWSHVKFYVSFLCYEQHKQDSTNLHCIELAAEISVTDISRGETIYCCFFKNIWADWPFKMLSACWVKSGNLGNVDNIIRKVRFKNQKFLIWPRESLKSILRGSPFILHLKSVN